MGELKDILYEIQISSDKKISFETFKQKVVRELPKSKYISRLSCDYNNVFKRDLSILLKCEDIRDLENQIFYFIGSSDKVRDFFLSLFVKLD